jgi:hypothetical protein
VAVANNGIINRTISRALIASPWDIGFILPTFGNLAVDDGGPKGHCTPAKLPTLGSLSGRANSFTTETAESIRKDHGFLSSSLDVVGAVASENPRTTVAFPSPFRRFRGEKVGVSGENTDPPRLTISSCN